MLCQILILLIIYLSSSIQDSKAAKQDYILSVVNQKKVKQGYIETKGKSIQGKVMSVCSWIKQEAEFMYFFSATDAETEEGHLDTFVDFEDYLIGGDCEYEEEEYYITVQDCNLKNITSWFHVCVIKNEPSLFFYLNGFPSENYDLIDNITDVKSDNVTITIGDTNSNGGNISLYQINAFDRVLTAKEVKDLYNCKFIKGDLISWEDITSKSNDFTYGENIQLIQAPVPCPTPPLYKGINCVTGEPLEDPSNTEAGEPSSSSTSGDSGSSSPSGDPGSSSPSADSGSSSPSADSGSSSPSANSGSNSPSADPGSSSTSGDSGSSSPSADSGSSSPFAYSGSNSPSRDSGSTSPNAGPVMTSEK